MNTDRELKKGSTPALILAVLAEGPRHGYSIAREIERLSSDALKLGEGTLYPALRTLEHEGYIKGEWEIQPSGPARKIYHLTESGKGELDRHKSAWRQFTTAVDAVFGAKGNAEPA